jgi:hypothetical protein
MRGAETAEHLVLVLANEATMAAATFILLVRMLRPHLGTIGFRRWATLTATQITAELQGASPAAASEDLRVLSRICDAKYRAFRVAVDLAAGGVVFIAAGITAAVLA